MSGGGNHNKLADEVETERLRQAALTDVTPEKVTPIKSAFHFFVLDVRESIREMAEADLRNMQHTDSSEPLDPYLVNSNMNCRLMKAWEELSAEERAALLTREEADRRRFMEEEEIASRHCATLTARSKSPKTPERRGSADRSSLNPSPANGAGVGPSPSPISRLRVDPTSDEKKFDDPNEIVIPVPAKSKNGLSPHPQHAGVGPSVEKAATPKGGDDGAQADRKPAKTPEKEEAEEKEDEKADDAQLPKPGKGDGDKPEAADKAAAEESDEKSSKGDNKEGTSAKRPSPDKSEKGGSPPKRNRVDEEVVVGDS